MKTTSNTPDTTSWTKSLADGDKVNVSRTHEKTVAFESTYTTATGTIHSISAKVTEDNISFVAPVAEMKRKERLRKLRDLYAD